MLKKNEKNYLGILSLFLLLALGVFFILFNLNEKIIFFYPPSKISEEMLGSDIRVCGVVKYGSINIINQKKIEFILTDSIKDLKVSYVGFIPKLFKDNQGVIVKGKLLESNFLIASEILIKHNEIYMPMKGSCKETSMILKLGV